MVVDAEMTMSRAAKILKFRPILAADNKRPSLLALHLLPLEFSGISLTLGWSFHVEILMAIVFHSVITNKDNSSRIMSAQIKT